MKKTNAMRLIDRQKIRYRVAEYEVDPDDLSGTTVAAKIGFEASQVFKTLLVQGKKDLYFAVVPVDMTLDLKAMASAVGERKVAMVAVKDIQKLTGYIRGGVTVLGARKAFPTLVHRTMVDFDEISISAGQRGLQILIDPNDYLNLVEGRLGEIATSDS